MRREWKTEVSLGERGHRGAKGGSKVSSNISRDSDREEGGFMIVN